MSPILKDQLKEFLDHKVSQYNNREFIIEDPVSIPHRFDKKEDIEIAGFLAATISWGQRKSIIKNSTKLIELMGFEPHYFVMNFHKEDLCAFDDFKHRTFNSQDLKYFLDTLKIIYKDHGGLERVFTRGFIQGDKDAYNSIITYRKIFTSFNEPGRTAKHIPDPAKGSAAKRINMFLRWMVRKDNAGVDFGLWKDIDPGRLVCPLDIHTGNTARKLGLLKRRSNDWRAAAELTDKLKNFNKYDPIKYDFALFGLGIFEDF